MHSKWEGGVFSSSNNTDYGHGKMQLSEIKIEGSQNNASYRGLPEPGSVSMKLLVTFLSLHDRVREQISMDNFKDNMPATILMNDTFQEYDSLIYGSPGSPWATTTDQTMVVPIRSKNLAYAISIVAYRNRTNEQLVGGGVYNVMKQGSSYATANVNDASNSRMDISMSKEYDAPDAGTVLKSIANVVGNTNAQRALHQAGDLLPNQRLHFDNDMEDPTASVRLSAEGKAQESDASGGTPLTRWNQRKESMKNRHIGETEAASNRKIRGDLGTDGQYRQNMTYGEAYWAPSAPFESVASRCTPDNGSTVERDCRWGPQVSSDPSFIWPNYKVVENFKTVKPTHCKLSIAGQTVYETAQQTAIANSYYSTTSDAYTPIKGGGQWFVEKDLDNLPYHYNDGPSERGTMGSVAKLPNFLKSSTSGGAIQEHIDAHVITFGLNKTDQLSNNGALGLSSATNAQLELKFAEPCRVSVYVHFHATLQIDSNTGVMSRSLDV